MESAHSLIFFYLILSHELIDFKRNCTSVTIHFDALEIDYIDFRKKQKRQTPCILDKEIAYVLKRHYRINIISLCKHMFFQTINISR